MIAILALTDEERAELSRKNAEQNRRSEDDVWARGGQR